MPCPICQRRPARINASCQRRSRVPEEQLLNPVRRQRRLFKDAPLHDLLGAHAHQILQASLDDLEHPDEVLELGMAVFIDRPLGFGKQPLEPDLTPLLAHETFSPSIAERGLRNSGQNCGAPGTRFRQEAHGRTQPAPAEEPPCRSTGRPRRSASCAPCRHWRTRSVSPKISLCCAGLARRAARTAVSHREAERGGRGARSWQFASRATALGSAPAFRL